ncbi:MAG TPA: hypothetical protein VHC69_33075 [Polyangiaceae bacterium]|nr:hypothetical protein [Polyangiaceae bacterium]
MKKASSLRLALLLVLGAGIVPSCANTMSGGGTDSSTHWLDQCKSDSDCGGLSCECGVCTKACAAASDCRGLSASASCAAVPGCSAVATVCVQSTVTGDASTPSTGGVCPANVIEDTPCDGRIEQCFTPCVNGGQGQFVCGNGTWSAGKGIYPCTNGTDCPFDASSGAACDGSVAQCWTPCAGGFKQQYACSGGFWQAGHGLFPCGADAGASIEAGATSNPGDTADSGGPLPGVSTSCTQSADCYAADRICCPRCDTEPTVDTKIGIAVASRSTYADENCATAGACPPCEPPPGTIDAFCKGGACDVEDLGKYKTCTKDADCKLVPKDCCACGTLPASAFSALSDAASFTGDRCATVDCAACPAGVHVADASGATCNTTYGYCEIAPPR